MSEIKITKEKALTAYKNAKGSGRKLLENLLGADVFIENIRERLNNWGDILVYHGQTPESFEKSCIGLLPHEVGYRKELMIVKAYNQGRESDFTDGEPKYCPVFKMGSPSGDGFSYYGYARWNAASYVGSRQLFVGPEAKENMLDAVKKFLPEYKESRTL